MLDESEEDRTPLIQDVTESGNGTKRTDKVLLLKCFVAVLTCYLLYAICHESIFKQLYGDERFEFTLWLMAVQSVVNCSLAFFLVRCHRNEKDLTPLRFYFLSATFFCGAIFGSNHALQYLSYPSQVVGKACKPIPVLLLSVIVGRKRYNYSKYGCVVLLVIGVTIFLYKPAESHVHQEGVGYILLLMSLLCDGLCGGMQEKVRNTFGPAESSMMLWTNFCSFFLIAPPLFWTDEFSKALFFILRHPKIIPRLLTFFLCSAIGQHFIFLTIRHFGPLTVSIFTTCRKFFTVLCSVVIFGNVLSAQQWFGALIVFTGLTLDVYFGDF